MEGFSTIDPLWAGLRTKGYVGVKGSQLSVVSLRSKGRLQGECYLQRKCLGTLLVRGRNANVEWTGIFGEAAIDIGKAP